MVGEFRQRYPLGCLSSELLQIHEGHYLVRVTVQAGGVTLATGLGGGNTIEIAEDRARERALVALGLTPPPVKEPNRPILPPTEAKPPATIETQAVASLTPAPVVVEAPVPKLDMLDILAQTTAEMKRLGWSNTQGREYLRRTYGRNSRQDLNDQELLDFLHYLRTQPAGNPHPPV
ncbi:hypothetical protein GlitD10_1679 [Gloeomargarita lithophora Alchichica-D10]|uniref:Uncharacterized protein n=1 Tax=Gloeomargarita lithophora Alchichica-D10 TaxID=1188229 RepID=A0A1J0ADJ0_9CYAN|nr:hypothetical protein [Gloeomargarita lithophora]APB34004.1 hypothetical protein GlitD10_1679 [Gloeomargarita lithophora Alchichica-D10]